MRKLINKLMLGFLLLLSFIVVLPLVSILKQLVVNGWSSLSWSLLVDLPGQLGEPGGLAPAIIGTLKMVFLAAMISVPLGLLSALFLVETKLEKLKYVIEFSVDLLNGAPSIIVGIFVYFILVVPLKSYSALAGAVSLSIIILPIVIKTSYEILRLFPQSIRMAGLALGLKRWHVSLFIVLWGCRKELLPGILNALVRASGETAPLLFTAFGSPFIAQGLLEPTAALPVQIYQYATSPYSEWNALAWSGSLLLVLLIFAMQVVARLITKT